MRYMELSEVFEFLTNPDHPLRHLRQHPIEIEISEGTFHEMINERMFQTKEGFCSRLAAEPTATMETFVVVFRTFPFAHFRVTRPKTDRALTRCKITHHYRTPS